jgi:hypothetical protein
MFDAAWHAPASGCRFRPCWRAVPVPASGGSRHPAELGGDQRRRVVGSTRTVCGWTTGCGVVGASRTGSGVPGASGAFDRMLDEIGTQLYRCTSGWPWGTHRGLLEHAEALYPRYVGRDSEAAYVVFQS